MDVGRDATTASRAVSRELGPERGHLGVNGSAIGRPFDESLAQAALAVRDHRAKRTPVHLARGPVSLAAAIAYVKQRRERTDSPADARSAHKRRLSDVDRDHLVATPA